MASFVSLDEYLMYYDITDVTQLHRAAVDLDVACQKVRDKVCQTIDLVEDDTITVYGTNTRALTLPEVPVIGTPTVTYDGLPVTDFTLDGNGILWRPDGYDWWFRGVPYTITYTHGYAPEDVPAVLKVAAFKLAHSSASVGGVKSETTGPYTVTYELGGDTGSEDDILAKLPVIKRVPVP